jgi:hypothetical protein
MSKLRSVSTAFWSDPFIEDLTPSEKLLFLYLITNDKTNMLGIYEVSIKKISFDTGLNKDIIEKSLKEFERLSKVKYIKNHIILVNFMKHQNYNTNMKKSAIDIYNELPNELKDNTLNLSKDNPIKGFESLLNHYGMVSKYEVEEELEEELELEDKEKNTYRSFVHLSISIDEVEKLKIDYDIKTIDSILDSIENYKDNKKYKSLYLTAKKWLEKEPKKDSLTSGYRKPTGGIRDSGLAF